MTQGPISIEVVGLEEVQTLVRQMPERVFSNAKKAFSRNAFELQKVMTKRSTTGPLRRRTGGLARSWQPRTSGTKLDTLKSSVASYVAASPMQNPVVYAPIHEFGGTIRSKRRNGFLTIPTDDNKTASGVMRRSAREVIDDGGHFASGVIISSDDKVTHILKRSVDIPARLGFFNAGKKQVPQLLEDLDDILEGL